MMNKFQNFKTKILRIFILTFGVIFGFVTHVVAQYGAPTAFYKIDGKVTDCKSNFPVKDYNFEYEFKSNFSEGSFYNKAQKIVSDSNGEFHLWFDIDRGQSPGILKFSGKDLIENKLSLDSPQVWKTFKYEVSLVVCSKNDLKRKERIPDIIDTAENRTLPDKPKDNEPNTINTPPPKEPLFDQAKEFIYLKPRHAWASELSNSLLDSTYKGRSIGTYAYTENDVKKEFFIENVPELQQKFPKQFAEAFPDWDYVITTFSKYSKDRK